MKTFVSTLNHICWLYLSIFCGAVASASHANEIEQGTLRQTPSATNTVTNTVTNIDAKADANADARSVSAPSISEQTTTPHKLQILVMLQLPAPHFHPYANYPGTYNDTSGHAARRRIALALAQRHGLKLLSDWPMPLIGVDCYVMELPSEAVPEKIAQLLSLDPQVQWAQPMADFHGLQTKVIKSDKVSLNTGAVLTETRRLAVASTEKASALRDPLYATQPAAKFWRIAELHQRTTGRKVRVAVIDSGVEDTHPDLLGQIDSKENFIDGSDYVAEAHGTAVAGIIAARAGNGIGIEGVAPGARIMSLRACWEESNRTTHCNSFTLGRALNFALSHNAKIINLSLTGPQDRLLQRLLDVAIERGVIVVSAIDAAEPKGGFPASHPGVIAVSDQATSARANSVVAPGQDVPTTAVGGRWSVVSGSSFAAAHVSGMMALISELKPSSESKNSLLIKTSGSQFVNACATIAQFTEGCACGCGEQNILPLAAKPMTAP